MLARREAEIEGDVGHRPTAGEQFQGAIDPPTMTLFGTRRLHESYLRSGVGRKLLPALIEAKFPENELRLSVRHAIMQVNYSARIRTVSENDIDALTVAGGVRRWVLLGEAGGMALTGLARKVLTRLHLLDSIVPQEGDDVL